MEQNMTWQDKINEWNSGIVQTYPDNLVKRFFYETSHCSNTLDSVYEEKFIESDELDQMALSGENYGNFIQYINKAITNNHYVTSFFNLSKDTLLIVPTPHKAKNYTTIKDFIDNAPKKQQIIFWKYVARKIIKLSSNMNPTDKLYISTHGLGVSYFHLRISFSPKYYLTKKFIK